MPEHTLGEWTLTYQEPLGKDDGPGYQINGGGQVQLAFVYGRVEFVGDHPVGYMGTANLEADAHLMVAAPDLLAACEDALLYCEAYLPECHVGYDEDGEDGRIANVLTAALAKAKGKTNARKG